MALSEIILQNLFCRPRLRELNPTARGSYDAGSRNLGHTLLTDSDSRGRRRRPSTCRIASDEGNGSFRESALLVRLAACSSWRPALEEARLPTAARSPPFQSSSFVRESERYREIITQGRREKKSSIFPQSEFPTEQPLRASNHCREFRLHSRHAPDDDKWTREQVEENVEEASGATCFKTWKRKGNLTVQDRLERCGRNT